LWNRSSKSNFSRQSMTEIVSAFLSRARGEIPSIIKEMKGKKSTKRNSEPSLEDIDKARRKNITGSGGGGGGKRTPTKVDYSKVSDRDLMDGKY